VRSSACVGSLPMRQTAGPPSVEAGERVKTKLRR
jgi:hypothetical protein